MKVKFPKRNTLFCYESLTPSNDPKHVSKGRNMGWRKRLFLPVYAPFENFTLTWRRKSLPLKGFARPSCLFFTVPHLSILWHSAGHLFQSHHRELVTFTPVVNLFNRFTLSQQDWFEHPIFRMRGDCSTDYVNVRVKCVKMSLIKVRFSLTFHAPNIPVPPIVSLFLLGTILIKGTIFVTC